MYHKLELCIIRIKDAHETFPGITRQQAPDDYRIVLLILTADVYYKSCKSLSDTTISRITDKILPLAKEWQQRPLETIYAVVFLDAIHYHVRNEGQIVKKAVYIAIGVDLDGRKDVLGMWVGENERAKFWGTLLHHPPTAQLQIRLLQGSKSPHGRPFFRALG